MSEILSLRADLAAATTAPAKLLAAQAIQGMREKPVDLPAMSIDQLRSEFERIKAARDAHLASVSGQNESGDGFTGEQSFVERLREIDDLIFRREWEPVWQERRAAWNEAVAKAGPKVTMEEVKQMEQAVGFTIADVKRAKAMFGDAPKESEPEPTEAPAVQQADPQTLADRQYLTTILEGAYSLNDADLFNRLEEIGGRYAEDPAMMELFTEAANKVTEAATAAAKAVL